MKKYITGIFIVLLTALPAAAALDADAETEFLKQICTSGSGTISCTKLQETNNVSNESVVTCTGGFNVDITKERRKELIEEYCKNISSNNSAETIPSPDNITVKTASLSASDFLEPATLNLTGRDPKNVSSGNPVIYNPTDEEKAEDQKNIAKYDEKKDECEAKGKAVKQNFLGMWVCTDTDETIEAREEEKKQNKDLKNFLDDMDKLERAFLNRVKKLNKESSKTGGQK